MSAAGNAKKRSKRPGAIARELMTEVHLVQLAILPQSATEFHSRLSKFIKDAHPLTKNQRERLALLVADPWKKKRGRPAEDKINTEIFVDYIWLSEIGVQPPITRAKAIRAIMDRYGATEDTAAKRYDRAKRTRGMMSTSVPWDKKGKKSD